MYISKTLNETAKGNLKNTLIQSIGLKCFLNCPSLFHLVFYLLQSNTWYFVNHLERFTYHYDSIGLKCVLNCLSLFHLVLCLSQSNTWYFANHLERSTYNYAYIYIYT